MEWKEMKNKKKKRRDRLINNKMKKPKSSIRINGKLKPSIEKCLNCKGKIKHHHLLCDSCWKLANKAKERKDSFKTKEIKTTEFKQDELNIIDLIE